MPVWTPGSYLVASTSRNVEDFTAASRTVAPCRREDPEEPLEGHHPRAPAIVIPTRLPAVHAGRAAGSRPTSHAQRRTDVHHPRRARAAPARLKLELPATWATTSTPGLPPRPVARRTTTSPRLRHALDCHRGGNSGVRVHGGRQAARLVNVGEGGSGRPRQRATPRRCAAPRKVGFVPYRSTCSSTCCSTRRRARAQELDAAPLEPVARLDAAGLSRLARPRQHEYFHAWNVKLLRPSSWAVRLRQRELHTGLWISEGFTDYYGDLMLPRGGSPPATSPHQPQPDHPAAPDHTGPPRAVGVDGVVRLLDQSSTGPTRTASTRRSATTPRAPLPRSCWTPRSSAPPAARSPWTT